MTLPVCIIIICIILIIFCGYRILYREEDNREDKTISLLNIILLTIIFTISFLDLLAINYPKPTAIDVYRGKTELNVTKTFTNDSIIKCDSSVVFKTLK